MDQQGSGEEETRPHRGERMSPESAEAARHATPRHATLARPDLLAVAAGPDQPPVRVAFTRHARMRAAESNRASRRRGFVT